MGLTQDELKVQELLAQKAELIRQISLSNNSVNDQVATLQTQLDSDKAAILAGQDVSHEMAKLEKIEKKLSGKLDLDA